MAKQKVKVPKGYMKVSQSQLYWIINAADTLSGMIGCGDPEADEEFKHTVWGIDRFLKANGLKRKFQ